jgi:hypothetical protein
MFDFSRNVRGFDGGGGGAQNIKYYAQNGVDLDAEIRYHCKL